MKIIMQYIEDTFLDSCPGVIVL